MQYHFMGDMDMSEEERKYYDSEAKRKWKAENTKNLVININKNTDKIIFDYLETLNRPYGAVFKNFIKAGIEREAEE